MQSSLNRSLARTPPNGLLDRLMNRAWEMGFFKAVWLLERELNGGIMVGDRGPVSEEWIRFRPDVSLGFPPTDLRRITECRHADSDRNYYRVDVTFLGLYGVATPLPLHYAVDILRSVEPAAKHAPSEQPVSEGDRRAAPSTPETDTTPVRSFLDLFHHRLISLFYRSWTKYRYDVAFGIPGRDVITRYLLWLIGCSPAYGAERLGVSPLRLIRYAGTLTAHPSSAMGLEGMLSDHWDGIPIAVRQFSGRWVPLAAEDHNRIGMLNSKLGEDLTVGDQVYDLSGAFTICVGPVDWRTYLTFLPDGKRFGETQSLTRLYCRDPLRFSLEITIRAGEAPETQLTSDGDSGRLGFTTWVRTDDAPEVVVIFDATIDRAGATTAAPAERTGRDDAPRDGRADETEVYMSAETQAAHFNRG